MNQDDTLSVPYFLGILYYTSIKKKKVTHLKTPWIFDCTSSTQLISKTHRNVTWYVSESPIVTCCKLPNDLKPRGFQNLEHRNSITIQPGGIPANSRPFNPGPFLHIKKPKRKTSQVNITPGLGAEAKQNQHFLYVH